MKASKIIYYKAKEYANMFQKSDNGEFLIWHISILNIIDTSLNFLSKEDAYFFREWLLKYGERDESYVKVIEEPYLYLIGMPDTINVKKTIEEKSFIKNSWK